jgi:hypothetical protein
VNEHPYLAGMCGILIIVCKPLAEFAGSHANDRVGVGVVVWRSPEDLDAKGPLREGFMGIG